MLTRTLELIGGRRLVFHGEHDGANGHLRLLGPAGGELVVPVADHGRELRAAIDLAALAPGIWHVEGTSLAPEARTGPAFVLPADGDLLRVRARVNGERHIDLHVTPVARHAEASRLWVESGRVELELSHAGVVVARRRGDAAEVRGEEGALDLAALARCGSGDETWRLWLLTPDGELLRIARHHDGIPGKRRRASLPSVIARGRVAQLRYTADDQLAVHCEPAPRGARVRRRPTLGRVSARRRWLGRPAILAHRMALGGVRRLPAPRPRDGGPPAVRLVLANAFGMGGTIRATLNLASDLARERPVEVISVRRHGVRPFFFAPSGVEVSALDDRTGRRGPLQRALTALPSLLIHPEDYAYPGASLWTDVQLVRRLRACGGDVVITTRPAYAIVAAAACPSGTTIVAQEHMHFHAHRKALARAVRRAYRDVDVLAVLTEADRHAYEAELEGAGTRVVRITGARVPPGAGVATLREPVIVAAGRLTTQKGFDLLIRAFAPIARAHPGWQLRIYGGGPEKPALRELIVAEGLHDHVLLMGARRDIGDALAEGSIFALSSRFEGFGMVMVEAMSRGLPIVAFDCTNGPAEVVTHGHDGLLVPPGDVDELSAALAALVADPERRAQLGAAALRTAQAYEPAGVAAEWAALLAEL